MYAYIDIYTGNCKEGDQTLGIGGSQDGSRQNGIYCVCSVTVCRSVLQCKPT